MRCIHRQFPAVLCRSLLGFLRQLPAQVLRPASDTVHLQQHFTHLLRRVLDVAGALQRVLL